MSHSKPKALLQNVLLALASLGGTLLMIEWILAPRFLPYLPLKLHGVLPREFRELAQSSKRRAVPEGYIALAGDSNAQGKGDWMLSVDADFNPPFHSAHLIRDATGRDVFSFGRGAAGSLDGLAVEPAGTLAYLARTMLYATPDPEDVLVYFYEGNDVENNVTDLASYGEAGHEAARTRDPDRFRRFLVETVLPNSRLDVARREFGFSENFVMTKFSVRLVKTILSNGWKFESDEPDFLEAAGNRAFVGGEDVQLPDKLQSPALELDEDQVELGLYVFQQSLAFLVERFPDAKFGVVYIPSPASVYRITSPQIRYRDKFSETRVGITDARRVATRSDRICGDVARISVAAGAGFFDLRTSLARAAETGFVHGPHDWKHLNRRGYEVLAEGALALLGNPEAPGAQAPSATCASMQAYFASPPPSG